MKDPLEDLKYTPYPGVENVEEVELPSGERSLAPSKQWSNSIADTPQGQALSALYMILGLLGVPPRVILTIAAVKFADQNNKIDFEKWISTRSGWTKEDQAGAILVLKTVEMRAEDRKNGKLPALGTAPSPFDLPKEKSKSPEDDWDLN